MPKLILVKHAKPEVDANRPSQEWGLSETGRASCDLLAQRLAPYGIAAIVSSTEPKASQTAALLGKPLGLTVEEVQGLHEHDRSNVPLLDTREFLSLMALVFKRPRERILGKESADQALTRFDRALRGEIDRHAEKNLAVVTHGTVIALWLERFARTEGYALWRKMGLPSFVVVDWPAATVIETVERV